ncbi:MAG TPA: TMEM175 family protein [Candidatus Acidoferrum sp.]|nr:TMEM175 family protein [Candidatus Acidoferrum sp.]
MRKSRAEAFSDGVFAVAATLLVFNLVDPKVGSGLSRALVSEWPSYAAYAISFSTIVVIWVNHHAVTDTIERFDRSLLFINGLLLLTIAVVPFPTGLLAHYLQAGHDQVTASIAYGLTMTTMGIAFSSFNLYARRFRPVKVPLDRLAFSTGLLLWPIATLASFVSVGVALALYAFIVLFYVALPILREDRGRPVASALSGPNPIALGSARAPEPNGGDLGEDA